MIIKQIMNVIYIHIGSSFPKYLNNSIKQTLIFNNNINIYVVVNQYNIDKILVHNNIKIINIDELIFNDDHIYFIKNNNMRKSRNGFWIYTIQRFFVLYEVMVKYNLSNLIHLESDNMLYVKLDEIKDIFLKFNSLATTFDDDNRGIGGIIYINSCDELKKLLKFINKNLEQSKNDMELLSFYKNETNNITNLPIIFKHNDIVFKSQKGRIPKKAEDYYKNYDNFNSIFDAACLGQFIGGCDPRNRNNIKEGFVNETCIFNPSKFKIDWINDEHNRRVPYISINNSKKYRINNLHIHSKELEKFMSSDSIPEHTNSIISKPIISKSKKYLICTFLGGPNNQYVGFRESIIIAKYTNRTLVLPFFCPHGTVKHISKRKIFTFEESFDIEELKKSVDIIHFNNLNKKPEKIYHVRREGSSEIGQSKYYLGLYKKVYNFDIDALECKYLSHTWFTSENDFSELNNIDDETLCICGIFNNVKLSKCSRNHCLNCPSYPMFLDLYNKSSYYFLHAAYIREEAQNYIKNNFNNNFLALHMRTSDTIGKKTFREIYIGCSEEDLYNSLVYYCNKFFIPIENIFLACPPAALKVKTNKILNTNRLKKFNSQNKYEPYIISLIEQEICSISTIFIRSITNTPHIPKNHTRSSWGTGVDDYRKSYTNTLNDLSVDKLLDDYKKNDRKNYIDYSNFKKPNKSKLPINYSLDEHLDKKLDVPNIVMNITSKY